jgi:hypothetical protein
MSSRKRCALVNTRDLLGRIGYATDARYRDTQRICANCEFFDDSVAYRVGGLLPVDRFACAALTTQHGTLITTTPDWFCGDWSAKQEVV